MEIKTPDKQKFPSDVRSSLTEAVSVKPNNALLGSASVRYPFPLGLWVYNNWPNPPKGLKHWIYEKLASEPVLVADVRPEVRVHMLDQILDNNGYFSGTSSYELVQKRNKKKASILYKIEAGRPYMIDSIVLLPDTVLLNHIIDSVARKSKYFQLGSRYSTDSLAALRVDIANAVRNRGYYFFRPDYIQYLADSTINKGNIALKLDIADNLPPMALNRYRTGDITTYIYRNRGGGIPDTTETAKGTLIRYLPSRLRDGLIPSCIAFREGRTFSVRQMNATQTRLARLGIFNNININVIPDTLRKNDNLLNVVIECAYDKPLEASVEANVSSKSNSYLGPGVTLGLTNRNLFGGGELLTVSLTGAYEWQTGSGRHNSVFNSYEIGLNATLAFPRLLAPRFIPRSRRELSWTKISLGADLLNRPHYFKLSQFNAGLSYDWQSSKYISNTFTLFKLTYNKLQHTTPVFDSIMNANPAIALSFQSQYIPQMSYSFVYDRTMRKNTINVQFTLQEAGNVFWSIYELCGKKGEKTLFRTPFSQFVKGYAQVVYGRRLGGNHWLVSRLGSGAAYAYGNSSQVPYSEQFYCGGANSVRAFTVRSIGPGSYRAPADQINGYFDQTGTFTFIANTEYRFPILGPLHGAVFLDAGNVWTLKNEPSRPGGQLRARTFFKDLAVGTGVGLRFDISMLVIRGDLGIGIHAPYDTGKRGYYNMESFKKSLAFHLAIGYPF
ncbi:translocation and assembly module lipoprotein TamL [Duncaniella muris]|uniref:translocation and assembly module lipoprotein TamL n=2 Tax=Duncaniella muris TaxID=2094150 RepID=UPI00272C3C73|nr:BamA/TamA family outer membrane protein [Duncaniella muris]